MDYTERHKSELMNQFYKGLSPLKTPILLLYQFHYEYYLYMVKVWVKIIRIFTLLFRPTVSPGKHTSRSFLITDKNHFINILKY
jgi:hypothetical protein